MILNRRVSENSDILNLGLNAGEVRPFAPPAWNTSHRLELVGQDSRSKALLEHGEQQRDPSKILPFPRGHLALKSRGCMHELQRTLNCVTRTRNQPAFEHPGADRRTASTARARLAGKTEAH